MVYPKTLVKEQMVEWIVDDTELNYTEQDLRDEIAEENYSKWPDDGLDREELDPWGMEWAGNTINRAEPFMIEISLVPMGLNGAEYQAEEDADEPDFAKIVLVEGDFQIRYITDESVPDEMAEIPEMVHMHGVDIPVHKIENEKDDPRPVPVKITAHK